ncbi:MAG: NAD-dependent epimerase/dehydratase family protein [Muribaculaceae bacterium]|nr:NAD-dependent epimerase/dehydratase family protein [Muribaculaceae bacterium]
MDEINFNPTNPVYIKDLEKIAVVVPWQELMGKGIAVSGATGLLGSLIIDFLLYLNKEYNANIQVLALGRSLEKIKHRFSEVGNSNLFGVKRFELSGSFPEIEVDYIIHCAGNSHPKLFAEDPVGTLMGNILGTETVLKYCRNHNAKALILSSGEIYGENCNGDIPMDEDYTGKLNLSTARSCYSEGKRAMEALTQSYISQFGVNAVIARPCRIFGPTMKREDNKASAQFIRNGLNCIDIVLKSSGEQIFSYIYSADAVSALLTILIKGQSGEAYNVANTSCNVMLKDLATLIANKTNVNVVYKLTGEPGGSKVQNALLDNTKICTLGWKGLYSIEEAINQTINILNNSI